MRLPGSLCRQFLLAGLSLICLLPLMLAQQNPAARARSSQVSSQLVQAQSALVRGDAEQAVALLSSYVPSHPGDIPARLLLGQAYSLLGQNDDALAQFLAVLKKAPQNVPALASAGEIYLHQSNFEQAEPLLRRAVEAGARPKQVRIEWALSLTRLHRYKEAEHALVGVTAPTSREELVAFHRLKASIASGLEKPEAAAVEMEKALVLEPADDGMRLATALAQLQSHNWQRAIQLAEPLYARTHDSDAGLVLLEAQLGMHADVRSTLETLRSQAVQPANELMLRQRMAEVLISQGQFAAAIPDLTRAIELDPNRADLFYNLALAQFKAGRLDDALQSAEKARDRDDNGDLEDLLGDIQESRGDNLAAVKSYQSAVTLAPKEEKYRLALAIEFIRHKSFEPARVVLKQAEELWPQSWRIQLALGMVEYFTGTDEQASRILLHAAELAPQPETALHYVGNIQMDMAGAPTSPAIAQLCGYADRNPKDEKAQYYCGGLMFKRDYGLQDKSHSDEILRRLHAAANVLPEDPGPHCQLGKAYRWIERWQAARAESENCVRLDPESADGHYRLAQIYQHLGDGEKSEQQMKLYKTASQHMADENARRDATIKTFLYTIQPESSNGK